MTELRRRWLPPATVALLALAATVTSIGHDFTYDDRSVILENERVHSFAHIPRLFLETYWPPYYGGDGYRPFVTTLFTLEWLTARGAPWVFHLVNILLAVAVSVAMYWCARAILPQVGAWVAAALFSVHPVHVEVTGNVVGQASTCAHDVPMRSRRGGASPFNSSLHWPCSRRSTQWCFRASSLPPRQPSFRTRDGVRAFARCARSCSR